jgi:hypothetical protein
MFGRTRGGYIELRVRRRCSKRRRRRRRIRDKNEIMEQRQKWI